MFETRSTTLCVARGVQVIDAHLSLNERSLRQLERMDTEARERRMTTGMARAVASRLSMECNPSLITKLEDTPLAYKIIEEVVEAVVERVAAGATHIESEHPVSGPVADDFSDIFDFGTHDLPMRLERELRQMVPTVRIKQRASRTPVRWKQGSNLHPRRAHPQFHL